MQNLIYREHYERRLIGEINGYNESLYIYHLKFGLHHSCLSKKSAWCRGGGVNETLMRLTNI